MSRLKRPQGKWIVSSELKAYIQALEKEIGVLEGQLNAKCLQDCLKALDAMEKILQRHLDPHDEIWREFFKLRTKLKNEK